MNDRSNMDPLLQARLTRAEHDGVSAKTMANYLNAYRRYNVWLRRRGLKAADVTPTQYENFVRDLLGSGASVGSCKTWLSCIKAAYRYHALRSMTPVHDPTKVVSLRGRGKDVAPRVFSMAELESLWSACTDERARTVFMVLAFTGLRKDEARTLAWADVDFTRRMLTVVGKGGKLRYVPLHADLAAYLAGLEGRDGYVVRSGSHVHASGAPVSGSTMDRVVGAMMEGAGVEGSAHTFRKTVATSLYRDAKGARDRTIDQIMGWAPRTIRDRHYIDVPDDAMQEAMACLYAGAWSQVQAA